MEDYLLDNRNENADNSSMDMVRRFEAVLEIVILSAVFYFIWKNHYKDTGLFPLYLGRGKYVLAGVYGVPAFLLIKLNDGFQYGKLKISDIVISQVISVLFANILGYFELSLIANVLVNFLPIIWLTLIDLVIIVVICLVYTIHYTHTHTPRRVIVIYGQKSARTLAPKMARRPDKYLIEKTINSDVGLNTIRKEILGYDAVVLNDITAKTRNDILKYCYEIGMRAYVVPKVSDIIVRGAEEIDLFDTPLLLVRSRGIADFQRKVKRWFDVILCSIAMIPALPIMGLVALAIKIDDHGPVFFRQERVTQGGKKFMILKFRSMIVDADKDGVVRPTTDNDDRITRVGHFIRPTRLDELPQLFNILKGDMSIVGPRPERTEHVVKYMEEIPEFVYRLKVPAGLTGYAQIYGRYNTTAYDKLRLDLMYIEQYSLLMDFKLILMTVRILFKSESTEGFTEEAASNMGKR